MFAKKNILKHRSSLKFFYIRFRNIIQTSQVQSQKLPKKFVPSLFLVFFISVSVVGKHNST
jgi:hypothetical protein